MDDKVNELKNRLNTYTREAAVIEIHLSKAQETMASAQELLAKLEDEYERWTSQVFRIIPELGTNYYSNSNFNIFQLNELTEAMNLLPRNALLGAAFLSYLSDSTEDERRLRIIEKFPNEFFLQILMFFFLEQKALKGMGEEIWRH